MDFDLDDPLGSDDSFFDEPKAITRKSSVSKTTEKKSIENLFGLSSSELTKNEPEIPSKKLTVTFDESAAKTEGNPVAAQKSSPADWLGETDSNVLEKSGKKTDFLDDLLSVRPKSSKSERKVTSFEDILKESRAVPSSKPATPVHEIAKPGEASSAMLATTGRDRRRLRRGSSTTIEDNLGLFGEEYQSGDYFTKDKKEPVSKSSEDFPNQSRNMPEKAMPDWLGGSLPALSKAENYEKTKENVETTIKSQAREVEHNPQSTVSAGSVIINTQQPDFSAQLKPQNINMEIQNTYSSLHQQESFLLVSLQLKKYEESLNEIKTQQKEILGKQEQQYHTLLDEYIVKQQMVENNIRLQQERINNQIQMLISSPHNSIPNIAPIEPTKENSEDLEHLLHSIKQRHSEEMFLMEESYKKQLDFMEKSNEVLEEKLKIEIKNISDVFEEKVNNVKDKFGEEVTYYKDKLKLFEEQHANEVKLLKENHSRILEELKFEHSTQLEYIKQMKQQENDLLGKNEVYSQKIDTSIDMLHSSTKVLQGLEEKVVQNFDILSIARENSIETREKEVILMRNALEKCREAAEKERTQLLALIRSLETKIAEQSNNSREDRWALQQASATLTARATAIERETEFNRVMIEREREQLKTLKESLLAEQETWIMQLTEEKLQLSTEKSRLQTSSKITDTYEKEKMRAEAEAAIQVAQELTEKVHHERSHILRQKNDLDALNRNLTEREKSVEDKELELEYLMQDAQRKLKEDKRVLLEAKRMETLYKERLLELQNRWASLSHREKKLAEDKVSLSKERLAVYTAMKTSKSCVLCKADGPGAFDHSISANIHEGMMANTISDPDAIRFRLEINEDEKESEVSREDNILFINEK